MLQRTNHVVALHLSNNELGYLGYNNELMDLIQNR